MFGTPASGCVMKTCLPSRGLLTTQTCTIEISSTWQSHLGRLLDPMKHSVRASHKKLQLGMDVDAHFSCFPTRDSIWPMRRPAIEPQRRVEPYHLAYTQQASGGPVEECRLTRGTMPLVHTITSALFSIVRGRATLTVAWLCGCYYDKLHVKRRE